MERQMVAKSNTPEAKTSDCRQFSLSYGLQLPTKGFLNSGELQSNRSEPNPVTLQTKPSISQPGDPYEKEANWGADTLERTPASSASSNEFSKVSIFPDKVQRKCLNSFDQRPAINSSEPAAEGRLELQRTALNQAVPCPLKSGILQAKLKIGEPDDIYEQEADRIAEQVNATHFAPLIQTKLVMSQPGDIYEQEANEVADAVLRMPNRRLQRQLKQETDDEINNELIQTKPAYQASSLIQRQEEEAEEESETEPEEVEEEEETIQRQVSNKPLSIRILENKEEQLQQKENSKKYSVKKQVNETKKIVGAVLNHDKSIYTDTKLLNQLNQTKSGGKPLPDAHRTFMENAFSADFRAVRIHEDSTSNHLSRLFNAIAFTNGMHIFFDAGRFDPNSSPGKKLLAHELTHVIQQNPQVRINRFMSPLQRSVQSQTSGYQRKNIGHNTALHLIRPAVLNSYTPTIQRDEHVPKPIVSRSKILVGRIFMFDAKNNPIFESDFYIDVGIPQGIYEIQSSGKSGSYIFINGSNRFEIEITENAESFSQAFRRARKTLLAVYDPTRGIVKDKPETLETPQQVTGTEEGGKAEETSKANEGEKRESGKESETETGSKSGSKYGWLSILNLPQDVINVLETVFEALGNSEEYLALKDLLTLLTELGPHVNEFKTWFENTDKLISVALGIEEASSITAIENWVNKPLPKLKPGTKEPSRKGIITFTKKVMNIIEKIRRILKPIIKMREGFLTMLGSVAMIIEEVPLAEELLEMSKEKKGTPMFKDLLAQFSNEAAKALQKKMEDVRKSFKMQIEIFEEGSFVTYEEIARTVTSAAVKAAKHPYIVIASKIPGLEQLVADNLVAKLIPKAVLDSINGEIQKLIKLSEPVAKKVKADLDTIFKSTEAAMEDYLVPGLENLFVQSSLIPGKANPSISSAFQLHTLKQQSYPERIDEDVRRDMEDKIGFDFTQVRIHKDMPAQRASNLMNANAFTLGQDIFFGPGKYAPKSQAGRKLLAHELTHVVQQRHGIQTGVIQRDYKEVVDKLVKKFGNKAIEGLRVAVSPEPEKQKRAEEIKEQVITKLRHREVISETNPKLPEAYYYVRTGKKISRIRRRIKWIRFVPALTIRKDKAGKKRIELGFLSQFDAKDAARKQLRRALGCNEKQQAHHVIPLELRDNEIIKFAESHDWKFNNRDNGVCISNKIHSSSHAKYTAGVTQRLAVLRKQYKGTLDWDKLNGPFTSMVDKIKDELKRRRKRLD